MKERTTQSCVGKSPTASGINGVVRNLNRPSFTTRPLWPWSSTNAQEAAAHGCLRLIEQCAGSRHSALVLEVHQRGSRSTPFSRSSRRKARRPASRPRILGGFSRRFYEV